MIYLITKIDVDRPRMGPTGVADSACEGWVCMHSDLTAAMAAFSALEVGPREVASLVEINTFAPTWTPLIRKYGTQAMREWFEQPPRRDPNYDPEADAAHGVGVAEAKSKKLGMGAL